MKKLIEALRDGPRTMQELQELTRLKPGTIRSQLKHLEVNKVTTYGLAKVRFIHYYSDGYIKEDALFANPESARLAAISADLLKGEYLVLLREGEVVLARYGERT